MIASLAIRSYLKYIVDISIINTVHSENDFYYALRAWIVYVNREQLWFGFGFYSIPFISTFYHHRYFSDLGY